MVINKLCKCIIALKDWGKNYFNNWNKLGPGGESEGLAGGKRKGKNFIAE